MCGNYMEYLLIHFGAGVFHGPQQKIQPRIQKNKSLTHLWQMIVPFSSQKAGYDPHLFIIRGDMQQYLVGGLVAIFYFPMYWVANHPNWRSYFSEGWPNHQPDMIRKGLFLSSGFGVFPLRMTPDAWSCWYLLVETAKGFHRPQLSIIFSDGSLVFPDGSMVFNGIQWCSTHISDGVS